MEQPNETNIQRAAKLLLDGAKMLQTPCPQCLMPIYLKRDSSLYCAECDLPVVKEDLRTNSDNSEIKEKSMESPIQKKIEILSKQLEDESDVVKIVKLSEAIRQLEKIRDS
jgi:uncharacterized Zn finger protein (UPF0148 family)